jgi:hypothetical protein
MTEHEIHSCIDEKNQQLVSSVEKIIGTFSQSMTLLITTENQTIKKSIDNLTDRVERQNGSVKMLREWKAKHDGAEGRSENSFTKVIKIAGVVIAIVMAVFGYMNLRQDNKDMKFELNMVKAGVNTDVQRPAMRGGGYDPFAQDTVLNNN